MKNTKKLYRSKKDKVLAGVAGGLGEYFEVDPIIVRLVFVLLTIWGGAGLLFYIIGAIIIPEETGPKGEGDVEEGEIIDAEKLKKEAKDFSEKAKAAAQDISDDFKTKPNRGSQIFGLIILFIGLSILGGMYVPWLTLSKLWPLILVVMGLVLIFNQRGNK